MRAIRGAITVETNTVQAIRDATCDLVKELERRNRLTIDEIVSAIFSLTPDLNATFPAACAREMGWDVPMLDVQEVPVPDSLAQCLRVLVHVDRRDAVNHVYMGGAAVLRPDLGGAD